MLYYMVNADGMNGLGHSILMVVDGEGCGTVLSFNGMQKTLSESLMGKRGVGKLSVGTMDAEETKAFLLSGDLSLKGDQLADNYDMALYRPITREEYRIVLEQAKRERCVEQPLVIHSDRGVQYTCGDYEEATGGMERSYSAKACPWDNACIESFHALIKREWISRFRIIDYSHAYRLVFEYIEAFYNTVRIHSHCGYRSPGEYEKRYLERMEAKMQETG